RTLAQCRYPAVVDDKKKTVAGKPALALLRVARKDGVQPEPRWDEQVEAAIGLALMQAKLNDTYQPDYAAQYIGAVIVEFASAYNDARNEDKGWKFYSARLSEALDAMGRDVAKNVKDQATQKYVGNVIQRGSELLKAVENKAGSVNPAGF